MARSPRRRSEGVHQGPENRRPRRIADGLARWCDFWAADRTDDQYIPHPATFLNQARYLDDPPQGRRSEAKGFDAIRELYDEIGDEE